MKVHISLNDKLKQTMLMMFEEMDIGVKDYRIEKLVEGINVYTTHITDNKKTELQLNEESSGTIKLFGLLPAIAFSILNGSALILDKLDANLHPYLLKYIIQLYGNREINNKGAQLIFTSHDLSTMNSDLFRRDEIWYVTKDNKEAATLYSLVEFARKDARFDKQYLEGKYGGCPYLQRLINWEDVR